MNDALQAAQWISELGRIPAIADHLDWEGMRLEVVDMDANRVDKLLVVPPKSEGAR